MVEPLPKREVNIAQRMELSDDVHAPPSGEDYVMGNGHACWQPVGVPAAAKLDDVVLMRGHPNRTKPDLASPRLTLGRV